MKHSARSALGGASALLVAAWSLSLSAQTAPSSGSSSVPAGDAATATTATISSASALSPSAETGSATLRSQNEAQLAALIQQIDAQGSAAAERIAARFAEFACTSRNASALVNALHRGTSVTLEANGHTATFAPSVNLGYGESYLALALATDSLRRAGVTGCATPEQWQAVLIGGQISPGGKTSAGSTRFPGIVILRAQGQSWAQIAQSSHVQTGALIADARSALKLGAADDSMLSPTGRPSAATNPSASTIAPPTSPSPNHPDQPPIPPPAEPRPDR